MGNVVKANFKKRGAVAMKCTACGAAGVAGCECGEPYLPEIERAKEGLKNPEIAKLSSREAGKEMGVSYKAVQRARNAVGTDVPTEKKLIGKNGKKFNAKKPPRDEPKRPLREIAREKEAQAAVVAEPRKLPKPPKIDTDVVKQAGGFHIELTSYTEEFCARVKSWHAAKQIDDESHECVVQALEMASMRLQRAAQDIDDR